jgi:flagellar biosynthesis anti-sigma factor FlgM
MRIDPGNVGPVGPKRTEGAPEAGKAEHAGAAEKVSSSAEVHMAKEAVAATADVRLDRVSEMRARIERGEFKVDAEKVAAGMVEGG